MEDKKLWIPTPVEADRNDVTTWALPEGAIARLGRGSVRDMAFSPNGQYFAVASAIGLWLYEFPTLSPIALWDTERGMTSSVVFSPDSRRIVTHTLVEEVKVWDIERGICTRQIEVPNRGDIYHPIFSQDGQSLIAANFRMTRKKNQKIYVWCPHTGTQIRATQMQHPCNVYPLCFSPDLSLLAGKNSNPENIGQNVGDGDSIAVWDVETGEQIISLTYSERVQSFCFSPCGQYLAAGGRNGTINVWNITNGQLEKTSAEYADAKVYPYFTPESELIVAAVSRRKVDIWSTGKGEKLDEFEHHGSNYARVSFSGSGKQLAVESESNIRIWTKGDNANTHTLSILHGHISTMDTLVLSADEKTLAAGFWRDNVLLWDIGNKRSYRPDNEKLPGSHHNVYLSPHKKIIFTNVDKTTLRVWEVGNTEPIAELAKPEAGLMRPEAFSPDGYRLAGVDKESTIHIWEGTSSQNNTCETENWKKYTTLVGHAAPASQSGFSWQHIVGLAFRPDGKRLVSIARDCTAYLWDVDAGQQITKLPLTPPPSKETYREYDTGIAFSPCGNIIAGGKWGEIVLWNATTGKTFMTLPQPEGSQRPITLCFSPCGQYLASGAWWQKGLKKAPIRLWEVANGKNLATFDGHTTDVQCFAFSEDGTLLISGGHDGAIYLWDLTSYL